MDLKKIALGIRKDKIGIYFSNKESNISYPEDGNENYMHIEENSFWFKHRNDIIAESVMLHSGTKTFYDIGGGNGFVAKRLQDEGVPVVLVEPGKLGAINAHKRGVKNVLCSTLEDAEFIPEKIDAVGLFDVVEHIENDLVFLKRINQYMKKNGHIFITVPAFNLLWSNEDNDAGHYKRYTTTKIGKVLESSGFRIVYSTYIFSILPLPVFLFRTLPSKIGLNKNSNNVKKHQKEHDSKNGIVKNLLDRIWMWELNRVRNNKSIPIGGSCFMIAQKIN